MISAAKRPVRVAHIAELVRHLPPRLAGGVYADFLSAEVRLTDAMDALDMTTADTVADALQWLRDDVRALRQAANEARLS